MAKYLIALACVACVIADDSGYNAPSGGYASPAGGYGAPEQAYAQPSAPAGCDAPQTGYEASYDAPAYEAAADAGGDLFDLSKILELLPLFLAVFAAIIVAQLFAPLLGMLFGAKINLASGLLAPLGDAKIGLINGVLAPFNLALCTITPLAVAAGRSTVARSLSEGFTMNADTDMVDIVAKMAYNGISAAIQSKYLLLSVIH